MPNVKEKNVLITYFIAEITGRARDENLILKKRVSNRTRHAAVTADLLSFVSN